MMRGATLTLLAILLLAGPTMAQDPAPQPPPEKKLEIKFKDAEIAAVLQHFSKFTGFMFVTDERAKSKLSGKIEVYSDTLVTFERAMALLNAALAQKGLTIYQQETVALILRVEDAIPLNINLQLGADPAQVEDSAKYITQIIPLKNLKVVDFDKNLKRLYPKEADTTPDPINNVLIMRGPSHHIRRFLLVLQHLDKTGFNSLKIEMLRLEHAQANDIAKILNEIFQRERGGRGQDQGGGWWQFLMGGGGGGGGRGRGGGDQGRGGTEEQRIADIIRIIPDVRTNSIIAAASEDNLALIRTLTNQLDSESIGVSEVRMFRLSYANAKDVGDVLGNLFRPATGGLQEQLNRQLQQRMRWWDPQGGGGPEGTSEVFRAIPDLRTNRLIVTATSNQMKLVEKLIVELDTEYSEILKVKIVRLRYAEAQALADIVTRIFEESASSAQRNQPQTGGRGGPQFRQLLERAQDSPSGTPATQILRIVPDTRTNSIIVSATEERLAVVEALIRELDADILDSVEFRAYSLTFADPTRVAGAITDFFATGGISGAGARGGGGRQPAGQSAQRLIQQQSQSGAAQPLEVKAIADTRTNSVIVLCSKTQVAIIDSLVREMDREVDELLKIKVYKLKNSDAASMATLIRGQFTSQTSGRLAGQGGQRIASEPGPVTSTVVVQTDTRTNSMIVTASEDNLKLIDELIAQLEAQPTEDYMTYVFKMNNANALDVQELIKGWLRGGVVPQSTRGVPGQTGGTGSRQQGGQQGRQGGNQGGGQGGGFQMQGPQVPGGSRNLGPDPSLPGWQDEPQDPELERDQPPQPQERPGLSGTVDVQGDPSTNTLFVRTSPRNYDALRRMIEELDRFRPQVLIRALMAEVTLDKSTEFGVEGFWENNIRIGSDRYRNRVQTNFGGGAGGFSYRLIGDEFDIGLRLLAEAGKLKVLATPRILTLDNQEASINVGKLVPFIQSSRQTPEGSIINTIQYQDIGILLRVIPHINEQGIVTMQIHPEISEIASASESVPISDGVTAPTFNRNAADTTVAIRNGQTVILGGLIREFEDEAESGIPILKDLPLLGVLFSKTIKKKERRELMIFITPHVVYTQQELEELTEIEKAQLKLMDPKDIEVKGREWRRFIRSDLR
jgi:type II secretion system protein D